MTGIHRKRHNRGDILRTRQIRLRAQERMKGHLLEYLYNLIDTILEVGDFGRLFGHSVTGLESISSINCCYRDANVRAFLRPERKGKKGWAYSLSIFPSKVWGCCGETDPSRLALTLALTGACAAELGSKEGKAEGLEWGGSDLFVRPRRAGGATGMGVERVDSRYWGGQTDKVRASWGRSSLSGGVTMA